MLPRATVVERGNRTERLAMCAMSSSDAPPGRGRAGDADVTADPDKPPKRVSKLGASDAMKMQLEAKRRRLAADYLQACGDCVGPHFELAEAEQLEHEAELVLDPVMHTTGRVTVGNGGEMVIGTKPMDPFIDTVRERPDMLAIDASQQRMELADKANVLTLGIDAAATIKAENSLEKMLAHQMAAAHAAAMTLQVDAGELLRMYKRTGCINQHLSIEAGRMMNASARMMESFQHGLLTIQKVRNGGRQTVVVQHVNVGDGGQAMVAGQVKVRSKRGGGAGGR
jgi:hypothetical protein